MVAKKQVPKPKPKQVTKAKTVKPSIDVDDLPIYVGVMLDLSYDPMKYDHLNHEEWMSVRKHSMWLSDTLHKALGDTHEG